MADDVEELLSNVEEEFGLVVDDYSAAAGFTPNELIEFIIAHMPPPSETMGEDEQLEHVESVLGELMVRTFGISRYDPDVPLPEIVGAAAEDDREE